MIYCPYCDLENIEGVDVCAGCQQSLRDLHLSPPASEVEKSLLIDRVSELEPRTPFVIAHTTPVGEVLKFLVDKGIGCVFVADGNRVVGVFTERDAFMRLDFDNNEFAAKPISEFMTSEPKSLGMNAKVAYAVRMMDQGGYRHILIQDESGKPAGVTSVRDILGYVSARIGTAS